MRRCFDFNTDARTRDLEQAKADSDRSLKAEINRLSRQLALRESSNTPMSAMTKTLPGAGSTNQRGVENDDYSDRLESYHTLGKLVTHNVLKTAHLTKTAPNITVSLPCNSALSNGAYFASLLPYVK